MPFLDFSSSKSMYLVYQTILITIHFQSNQSYNVNHFSYKIIFFLEVSYLRTRQAHIHTHIYIYKTVSRTIENRINNDDCLADFFFALSLYTPSVIRIFPSAFIQLFASFFFFLFLLRSDHEIETARERELCTRFDNSNCYQ